MALANGKLSALVELSESLERALSNAGFHTAVDVLYVSPGELSRQLNIKHADAIELFIAISQAIYSIQPRTAYDMVECAKREITEEEEEEEEDCPHDVPCTRRLTTGCAQLNAILGGGIPTTGITEIAGESGTGKTQLALQLALNVQLPHKAGGLHGAAVYLCTEAAFPARRLNQLISEKGKSDPAFLGLALADNIFVEHVGSVEEYWEVIDNKLPILLRSHAVRLLVLDSIAGMVRSEYETERMAERAAVLFKIGAKLKELSDDFHMAVVCLNQVTDLITDNDWERSVIPALGLAWSNIVNTRLLLTRHRATNRRAMCVCVAPHLPPSKKDFVVEAWGVRAA
eukprot:Colp12_sorted_trinity150504_noHs@24688